MYYGGDYNPEQWPEAIWVEDVRLMREAKVNLVTLGIFAWSRIQPAEGEFDFEWLDRIIGMLHDGGIAVDLATATASPPPWVSAKYPEILPSDENGATYWPGSRQHYAPTSPDYRRLASALVSEIAGRYVDHPAVRMWHVNNEYGCHVRYDYSDNAARAFRVWLRDKYGTIEGVNHAWRTDFWSQRYTSFDEVMPPRKSPYSTNPSGQLDFKRFTSDSMLSLFTMERDIIRGAGATQPITTNFMGLFPPVDYWKWAEELDFISDDSYPDPNDPEAFRAAALSRDLMRSLKPGVPWLLMEQASSAVSWRASNAPKAPGQMAALSMQAVARGADGVMFFQWRQSRAGSEKFHSAMLPHVGTGSRVWREVVQLGEEISHLPDLPAGATGAHVAIVLDWDNLWALQSPDHPVVLDYPALLQTWYSAAHRAHVQVDFVRPTSELDSYTLVLAPHLYLMSTAATDNFERYVRGGGNLLVTAFSDIVDENDHFLEGGFLTRLGPVLGVSLLDVGGLALPGGPGQATAELTTPMGAVTGTLLAEEIELSGAELIGRFVGGRLDGRPALTRNSFGAGSAWYLATIADEAGTKTILAQLLEFVGVEPVVPDLPEQVEAVRRGSSTILINQSGETVVIGSERSEPVVLEPFEYRIRTVSVDDAELRAVPQPVAVKARR